MPGRDIKSLTAANISWQAGQPKAADFDDIYFSADGIAETLRVFIQPSEVLAMAQVQPHVCVGELGFGTGLNFAVCATEVLSVSQAQLHFISFEKHPLRQTDWQQVTSHRANDLPLLEELRRQPLPLIPGWHKRVFAAGRIHLSVFHGEVSEGLADLFQRQKNPVDAWFLDGFAPSKNPAMWTPEIYQQLALMSHQQTTVSTFTAAGHVRRGLIDAGFDMRRIDQQPLKRESLAGVFQGQPARTPTEATAHITIHGAGVGGACMARHFAEHNLAVTVYDPGGIAGGASRIEAAVMHSRLLGDQSADADLRCAAFHYAANYVQRFAGADITGVLQVQGPNLDGRKIDRITQAYDATHTDQAHWIQRLDQTNARSLSATKVDGDALWFPTAGVINLPILCASLLDHPLIEVVKESKEIDPQHCNIICTGSQARQFPGCKWLEITDVHGQLDWFTSPPFANLPIIGNGYLVPTDTGYALGATYEHKPWTEADATAHNRESNAQYFADAGIQPDDIAWQRSVRGARAVSSDRIPVIGKLNADVSHQNLWIATAFGSMGTTAAPLAAAMISSEILGWLPPVSPAIQAVADPQRFKERQARRGVRHIK
jgi:tRNA 5-methylaminomethyl-2-thiouridine biosynthesis bifunctional protein